MIRYCTVFFIFFLFPLLPAFGTVDDFSLNGSSFVKGDIIKVSGTVQYDPENNPVVIITILPPDNSRFVAVDQKIPNSNGSFSASFKSGSSWTQEGTYTLRISYGTTSETTFQYFFEDAKTSSTSSSSSEPKSSTSSSSSEPKSSTSSSSSEPKSSTSSSSSEPKSSTSSSSSEPKSSTSSSSSEPKSSTSSSSSTYESEPNPELGIASFVDHSKDPWDYVERYKTEPNYKKWFDDNYSQYSSIFEAVGLPEPQENIPSWIKNTASRWAENQIDDGTFIQGIEFMLENDIILISEIPESASSSAEKIPNWVRSNAGWWSQNIISESEFTNSLKYLIEKGIIVIN